MQWEFADHRLDDLGPELRRAGARVAVEPKALHLLVHLVRNRHRIVPKLELLDAIWPDAIVGESTLTRIVCLARQAVGDTGGRQAVIRTESGRGYRFAAEVRAAAAAPVPGTPAEAAFELLCDAGSAGDHLHALWEQVCAGRGRVALVPEPGLVRVAGGILARPPAAHVSVRARAGEGWSLWQRAVEALVASGRSLTSAAGARLLRELRSELAGRGADHRAPALLITFLRRLTARGPVWIGIEAADHASAQALSVAREIAEELSSASVLVALECAAHDLRSHVVPLERLLEGVRAGAEAPALCVRGWRPGLFRAGAGAGAARDADVERRAALGASHVRGC